MSGGCLLALGFSLMGALIFGFFGYLAVMTVVHALETGGLTRLLL